MDISSFSYQSSQRGSFFSFLYPSLGFSSVQHRNTYLISEDFFSWQTYYSDVTVCQYPSLNTVLRDKHQVQIWRGAMDCVRSSTIALWFDHDLKPSSN